MHKPQKQHYLPPRVSQTVSIRLERSLLNASVAKDIQPVETAGQEVDHIYDMTKSSGSESGADFNHYWGNN